MNYLLKRIIVPVFIMVFIACNSIKKSQLNEITVSEPLDSLISGLIQKEELIGAELYILKDGNKIFHRAYGWTDLGKKQKIQKNDIWAVKSMTKPVTATAILILSDEGLLSLDDPVTKYIPQYKGYKQATIRNLLLQNSGDDGSYGNYGENIFDFNSQEDWVLNWANQVPKGAYGVYEYSNFNYEALGYIISKVTQKPVEEFIHERIIWPLELENTYTHFSPNENWANRVPYRYRRNDNNEFELLQTNKDNQSWTFFPASFGLWMSNEDFATFLQMWMNSGIYHGLRILKESTIKEALEIGVWISKEDMAGQGLGWQIETKPFNFYKGGADGSIGVAYPKENTIIVFTTHLQSGRHGDKIWDVLEKYLFD